MRLAWTIATALAPPATAWAQFPTEAAKPSPAALFRTQCATCHVLNATDGQRQGPPLAGVVGRKPGSAPNFKYSANYATADFIWDAEHLDAYLANPQAVIPGSIMVYRQGNAATRATIIAYLTEAK